MINKQEKSLKISSETVFGTIHALTSLAQDDQHFTVSGEDEPYYKYRGMLIDTVRHFIPLKYLKRIIATMEMNKLNIFHWHLTDDQAVSILFPAFEKTGNIDSGYYDRDHVYSKEDVIELKAFARERGIQVIPEIDMPGHTQSWNRMDQLLTQKCDNPDLVNSFDGPLDVTSDKTYKFIEDLIADVNVIFGNITSVHLGLDEVRYQCWDSNANTRQWMLDNGIGTYEELQVGMLSV